MQYGPFTVFHLALGVSLVSWFLFGDRLVDSRTAITVAILGFGIAVTALLLSTKR